MDEATDDEAVVVVEGVCRAIGVHLLFIVAPAMVADFVAEVGAYGCVDIERGFPVYLFTLGRGYVLGWWWLS